MYTVFLLGKTNVGKSSLYNALSRKRDAIVTGAKHYTRDIKEGIVHVTLEDKNGCGIDYCYCLQDAAGLEVTDLNKSKDKNQDIDTIRLAAQEKIAVTMQKANLLLLVVDVQNLTAEDKEISQMARASGVDYLLCANKVDSNEEELLIADIFSLGLGKPILTSAKHDKGIYSLQRRIVEKLTISNRESSKEKIIGCIFIINWRKNNPCVICSA